MRRRKAWRSSRYQRNLQTLLAGPQLIAFVPAIALGGFWLGGEQVLLVIAIAIPALFLVAGLYWPGPVGSDEPSDAETGLMLLSSAIEKTDRLLNDSPARSSTTAALAIGVDEMPEITERHGPGVSATILRTVADRVRSNVREIDIVARLEGPRLVIVLTSGGRVDLESLIQVSTRIQKRIEEPITVDGMRMFVTASVGFCTLSRAPEKSAKHLLEAAKNALDDAMSTGTGAIRAFTVDMQKRSQIRTALSDEITDAIESNRIVPWFQPQVATGSGEVTGFEVLARWDHPKRGILAPGEFLPAVNSKGLLERLGEVMLFQSLTSLRSWDTAGISIPKLSINFSAEELRNPMIVDKIRWELDRFDLAPNRISVEVLETVIAQNSSDVIIRNLRALSDLGCPIDLDDFGTGHASIANIKRFSVSRIKIDKSFVTHIDSELDQQNIVSAILTLADRLGLETLAEGVETAAEQAVLHRLGCGIAQGYFIGRPMPFAEVGPWVASYDEKRSRQVSGETAAGRGNATDAVVRQGKTA